MIVKHNHNCMLCSTQKTCFVFQEFSILFAVCRGCYDKVLANFSGYDVVTDFCSFCEQEVSCRVIDGFSDSMFFVPVKICDECYTELKNKIALKE